MCTRSIGNDLERGGATVRGHSLKRIYLPLLVLSGSSHLMREPPDHAEAHA